MEYQSRAFSKLAGPVDLACNSLRGPLLNGRLVSEYPTTGRGFNSLNHYGWFYREVAKHASSDRYDFLYVRYPLALPSFIWFLRHVKAVKGFYVHAFIFFVVNSGLLIANLTTPHTSWWSVWPMVGWGVGLAANWGGGLSSRPRARSPRTGLGRPKGRGVPQPAGPTMTHRRVLSLDL